VLSHPGRQIEPFNIQLGRVSVILGPNGTDKSTALARLVITGFVNAPVVFIKGGRTIRAYNRIRADSKNSIFANLDSSKNMDVDRYGDINERLRTGLDYLLRDHAFNNIEYSTTIKKWKKGKLQGEPSLEGTRMDVLLLIRS
jgi:hypothetical protein